MQDYRTVVETRYDREDASPYGVLRNPYSGWNRPGRIGDDYMRSSLYALFDLLRPKLTTAAAVEALRLLDIGCGGGRATRQMAEICGRADNIYGIDLSTARIDCARRMNDRIHYAVGDITEPYPFGEASAFDAVTAFVALMHLSDRETLHAALGRAVSALKPGGLFLWYDELADTHFASTDADDHRGFSVREMDDLCADVGLRLVHAEAFGTVIRGVPLPYRENVSPALFTLLDRLPLKKSNALRIYEKEKQCAE